MCRMVTLVQGMAAANAEHAVYAYGIFLPARVSILRPQA